MRPSNAATAIASLISEKDWQAQLCDLLEATGWSWVHVRAGRTQHGWRVPTSGPLAAGWPDLVAVSPVRGRIAFIECKAEGGRLAEAQRAVQAQLRDAGAEVYTWRPSDLPLAVEILQGGDMT